MTPPPETLLTRIETEIARYDSLLVAFSGGVDSSVLLAAAHRVLGDRCAALTADSASMARSELDASIDLANRLGVRQILVRTDEIARDEYARNDRNRCYFCKQTLFEAADDVARQHGFTDLAYGYTLDDVGEIRPGHRAAEEVGVHAPLHDARLGKREIRAIAAHLGLPVWDKPAAPCLASRIPYGSAVTATKLERIERMESLLHDLGFRVCRARYDGELMRIEVETQEIARISTSAIFGRIEELATKLGVGRVVIDEDGFQSGKMNRIERYDLSRAL
jgi:TIGR00268 family protein